jgi:MoxR-like ATPase
VARLAKTLTVKTLPQILGLSFNPVQFTPDLVPSDITGMEVLVPDSATGERRMRFMKGPIFASVLLGDEINRTPPKTQAALLQAMQERQVTAGGETYQLDLPFFVLATQNPIELEGTYPLPEAQLDRFMFNIFVDYPSAEEEIEIVESTTSAYAPELEQVLSARDIMDLQQLVRRVPVPRHVVEYAVRLARSTRPDAPDAPAFIKDWISWGAGPRASQYLILGAKTRSIVHGRYTPSSEDVRQVARPVLRHRIITNFNAEADGVTTVDIVSRLLEEVPEVKGD